MLSGEHVLSVEWLPGSDRLRGTCFCGVQADGEDPVQMWEWLLSHPDHPRGGPDGPAPIIVPPPAHYIDDPRKILRPRPSVLV